MHRVHGSFHVGFSVVVVTWNMSLFKEWGEDKLNKKFVLAEIFAELVSKGIYKLLHVKSLISFLFTSF